MVKLSDLRMRDPYIVPYKGMYYLYGTVGEERGEKSLYVYRSKDLENWEDAVPIFTIDDHFWGVGELWAPEVHIYNSKFYLFFSVKGKNGLRGTQIAVSDALDGTFVPVTNRPATPLEQSCIDGTLYVENGVPYIVYSHDWPDNYVENQDYYLGEICALQLNRDLSESVGEPFVLFNSREATISASKCTKQLYNGAMIKRYGTDGPFFSTLNDGRQLLTWSPIPGMNYIVLAAISETGSIHGPWKHYEEPIFDNNGGHAMFFNDFEGKKKMCIHWPERYPEERVLILDVIEKDGTWKVV